MEQVLNIVVQNGLGVASFLALIYFMQTSLKDMSKAMNQISTTLIQIQLNLSELNARVDSLEERKDK